MNDSRIGRASAGTRGSVRLLGAVAATATVLTLAGCMAEKGPPSTKLPPQDTLSTETSRPPVSTTSSSGVAGEVGLGAALDAAGRVDLPAPAAFVTPDDSTTCSITATTLTCTVTGALFPAPPKPDDSPTDCAWDQAVTTLGASGPRQGACRADVPAAPNPKKFRNGEALGSGPFRCIVDATGLYCLDERSSRGFAVSPSSWRDMTATTPVKLVSR